MRARDRRVGKLRVAVNAAPVLPHLVDEAYEAFWMFGELPDEDNVADAVMRRAMRGGEAEEQLARRPGVRVVLATEAASGDMRTVREPLFEEALHENSYVRRIARCAIELEVTYGGSVESPGFAARHGLPIFGTVGMHVFGYPRKWAVAPYEHEGKRLLTLYDELRARINHRNPKWFDPIGEALFAFETKGELPSDDFLRDFVLVDAALEGLRANFRGRDVREVMGYFTAAIWRDGDERDTALTKLCEIAKEGRLP